MSELFGNIFIFCIVLVFYLHIYRHSKTSNDLEVFEITDDITSEKLNEVLEFLQPAIFKLPPSTSLALNTYGAFDIKIRNSKETSCLGEMYLPLCLTDAIILFQKDVSQNYFSEKNMEFLQETGLIKHLEYYDEILKPSACCHIYYDLVLGSTGVTTPLRYHMNYREFICLQQGSITIKVCPPKSNKYLDPISDYDNFEFRSLTDPWKEQQSKTEMKVKFMDIEMKTPGDILFLPPYWWYSIKINTTETQIAVLSYRTCVNSIYISPHFFRYILQRHNIKNIIYKSTTSPPP